MAVYFFEEEIKSKLKNRRKLSSFLTQKANEFLPACKSVHLNYIFCTDESLYNKNIEYLNHDTYTDILTFDLSENEEDLQAEIYISIDRIIDNAEKFKVSYQNELHRVIFHGLLHLCGFNDETEKEIKEMRLQEQKCIDQYLKIIHEKA